jgi:dsDNA-binding SOS-regulon protein
MEDLKQVFTTPDGQIFETRVEAQTHLRLPKVKEALDALTEGNEDLSNWLVENKDTLVDLFDVGTIRRVSKTEKNKLRKALDYLVEQDDTKAKFVTENAEAIFETFRYPTQKRLTSDEKDEAIATKLNEMTEGNEDVSSWVATHREDVLKAYDAGKPKREVSPKAQAALAAYREKQAADKAAREAA